ncbi:MAG: hypothetical protein KGS72_27415 [Cyanobacteria bacterium REEB67]|nr:hypothetical protein [Cyanobacteria bacterium REEB67]
MTDTASDIQTITAVDTSVMDHLFSKGLLEKQKVSLSQVEGVFSESEGIPVDIAAARLGLPASGVLKRLRKGVYFLDSRFRLSVAKSGL